MVPAACAFLAGCCALLLLAELPGGEVVAATVAAAALSALALRAWPILALALGFAAAWLDVSARLNERLDPSLEGRTVTVRGTVSSVPQLRSGGVRFRFATVPAAGIPPHLELTWYEPDWRPLPAERLELDVRLRRPRGTCW